MIIKEHVDFDFDHFVQLTKDLRHRTLDSFISVNAVIPVPAVIAISLDCVALHQAPSKSLYNISARLYLHQVLHMFLLWRTLCRTLIVCQQLHVAPVLNYTNLSFVLTYIWVTLRDEVGCS